MGWGVDAHAVWERITYNGRVSLGIYRSPANRTIHDEFQAPTDLR